MSHEESRNLLDLGVRHTLDKPLTRHSSFLIRETFLSAPCAPVPFERLTGEAILHTTSQSDDDRRDSLSAGRIGPALCHRRAGGIGAGVSRETHRWEGTMTSTTAELTMGSDAETVRKGY